MDMMNISKRNQSQRDDKCKLKVTNESSMNDDKSLISHLKL